MKIFLTGATSGLGRNAAEWLLQAGHQVHACGRNAAAGAQLSRLGAQFSRLDLRAVSPDDCLRLMADCDAVWHCAALSSPWGRAADFYQHNVAVTERLAEAAGRGAIRRFIHISTPAIYFDYRHHRDIDERYRARRFACHYAHSKYLAEQRIMQLVPRFPQTRYTILRPRGLFGPHDRVIVPRIIAQITRGGGVLRLPRAGETLLDLTFVGNVVQAMALASENDRLASGDAYNITNHQPERLAVMLRRLLAERLGLSYQVKAVPYPALYALAGGMECLARLSGKEPMLTRYSVGAVNFDMTLSRQRAQQELGYRPRFSLEQGIDITGQWLARQGENAHG
ncbi:NAD(P)-dependent oxidoreductase [Affinibrenneria salicis]|uniref:NAD(P)-dependent oxidoreductase n=1 Tax=Affinibrenneria salicis TaxID=2590031 RepID=A0A5J5G0M8_9GAMM|nr:NAD(P)-dependent oxidoreductase [Affinibrenneria salicis]KAA9000110.1 NAD(P)-dependent oxidoreductase [Affinibrenneria salicis]